MLYFRLVKSVPNISSNILKHLQEETIKQLQTNIEVGRHCGFKYILFYVIFQVN